MNCKKWPWRMICFLQGHVQWHLASGFRREPCAPALPYYNPACCAADASIVRPTSKTPAGFHASLFLAQVDFRNVQMRYRDGLPLVLQGLSVKVSPGSRCGVVGRTGAGKSSLINCLFRLQELCGGSIVIDGVDIAKMGLKDLRSNMAIIPQVTPPLFQDMPFTPHHNIGMDASYLSMPLLCQ